MKLKSSFSIIERAGVINLAIEDLDLDDYQSRFSKELFDTSVFRLVINLDAVEHCSSVDILRLERLIELLRLNGRNVVVCGIQPSLASVLVSVAPDFKIPSFLNVRQALYALDNQL